MRCIPRSALFRSVSIIFTAIRAGQQSTHCGERKIDVRRTDEDGLVTVVSDGRRLSVETGINHAFVNRQPSGITRPVSARELLNPTDADMVQYLRDLLPAVQIFVVPLAIKTKSPINHPIAEPATTSPRKMLTSSHAACCHSRGERIGGDGNDQRMGIFLRDD